MIKKIISLIILSSFLTTSLAGDAPIPASNGGTGQSTYSVGDILFASATGTLSKLNIGASNTVLIGGTNPSWTNSPTFLGLHITGLTPSYTVVTDSSGNLASIAYGSANTPSTFVMRDSSGNFSAGTITAALNGNALTVTTNANLTGDVTSVGNATTIANTAVTAGTYGNATHAGTFTVNAKGQLTAASNTTISGVTPGGAAGGDLSGSYPSPGVSQIAGVPLGSTTATAGNLLIGSGAQWVTHAISGNATLSSTGVLTIGALQITNAMLAGAIDLTAKVINDLPFANGGFGFHTATTGDIFYASATNTPNKLPDVATGSVLISGGIGVAPSYASNFSAGTITAALTGNASTATTLQTARAINGVNFDGSGAITVPAAAGTLTGTTLASNVVTSSLTSVGTIASGTWSGSFGAVSGANLTSLTAANISAGTAGINISGNSSTVTTNANLTGDVTSVGNATTIAANAVTNSKIANTTIDLTAKVTGILPNSNTTATNANTASTIVARDSSGNFSAGTITLTGMTLRSVPYISASGALIQDNSNFVYDGGGHNLFLGSNNINPTAIGRLNITGTDSTIGASEAFYTSADTYPLLQLLPFAHDNVLLSFDAYYSGGWFASSSNSSFQIAKISNALNLNYVVGTAGSSIAWSTGLSLSNTGTVTIPELTANNLVTTGTGGLLTSTNTLSSTVLGNIPVPTVTILLAGASGNYTPPAGCTHFVVYGWGGGGGGGGVAGAASNAGAAGGGASGGHFRNLFAAPFSSPYAYSVGAGGAGGVAGANNGSVGSNTTFGTFTAGHGAGGTGVTSGLTAALAAGGNITASSGAADIITNGQGGFNGFTLSASIASAGAGAPAPGGGAGGRASLTGAGANGSIPGGGGAGAASTNATSFAGGNGADGKIVIYEYYNG